MPPGQLACKSFFIMLQHEDGTFVIGGDILHSNVLSFFTHEDQEATSEGIRPFFPAGAEYKLSHSHAWTCPSSPQFMQPRRPPGAKLRKSSHCRTPVLGRSTKEENPTVGGIFQEVGEGFHFQGSTFWVASPDSVSTSEN